MLINIFIAVLMMSTLCVCVCLHVQFCLIRYSVLLDYPRSLQYNLFKNWTTTHSHPSLPHITKYESSWQPAKYSNKPLVVQELLLYWATKSWPRHFAPNIFILLMVHFTDHLSCHSSPRISRSESTFAQSSMPLKSRLRPFRVVN